MSEINRILKPGGHVRADYAEYLLAAGDFGDSARLSSGIFSAYIRPAQTGRRARCAAQSRIHAAGDPLLLRMPASKDAARDRARSARSRSRSMTWVPQLLERYKLPRDLRGDGIYAVGRKTGPVRERYPGVVLLSDRAEYPRASSASREGARCEFG